MLTPICSTFYALGCKSNLTLLFGFLLTLLKFGQYCKVMLPFQKAGVYRLENSP